MRIKEEFRKLGNFWLPSAPERTIPGTLLISDGGNIELEVLGIFEKSEIEAINGNNNFKRIVGLIEGNEYVTLEDCFYRTKAISPFGGISKVSLYVTTIFIGAAYDEGDNIFFDTVTFSIEGIDEWVGISGIKAESRSENPLATISYERPEEISFKLKNGMQLLITFDAKLHGFPATEEAKITPKSYFKLVSTLERELDEFISVVHNVTTFLCFATDKTVCLDSLRATSDSIWINVSDTKTRPVSIEICYRSLPYSKDEPKIYPRRMLFRFAQIRDNVERLVNNWIEAYDQIDPALNLYFSTKTGAQKYLDGKFLALAQGLETYHRRISDEKLMDEGEFKELVENLVYHCGDEHKTWLEERLKHGNEINLRRRIKRIIEPFKDVIGTKEQRGRIITRIVDTRNYLTHYDESLKEKIASGRDLALLCLKMEAFFQLNFLKILGFTCAEIKSIVNNCDELKQKLNET